MIIASTVTCSEYDSEFHYIYCSGSAFDAVQRLGLLAKDFCRVLTLCVLS
jgi:hypothetical protein